MASRKWSIISAREHAGAMPSASRAHRAECGADPGPRCNVATRSRIGCTIRLTAWGRHMAVTSCERPSESLPCRDDLPPPLEDRPKLVRRDDLELGEGAVARLLVRAPAAELRRVPEAHSLHVIVGDLDDQLRAERLPGKILALAPAALRPRPALPGSPAGCRPRPSPSTGCPRASPGDTGAR